MQQFNKVIPLLFYETTITFQNILKTNIKIPNDASNTG